MNQWYTHPQVFIRSLATRGALGGLHPKILEITSIVTAAGYDYIFIETVGVGQSEIEIAGLADVTVVVLVPESGDDVQSMKAGLMEIADVFVVNKSDRPDADRFVKNLRLMLAPAFSSNKNEIQVIKTVANQNKGIDLLYEAIKKHQLETGFNDRKLWLLTDKVYHLIQKEKMRAVDKTELKNKVRNGINSGSFNLYKLAKGYFV